MVNLDYERGSAGAISPSPAKSYASSKASAACTFENVTSGVRPLTVTAPSSA